MSYKKIYTCDICRDEIKNIGQCFGVHFHDMVHFDLSDAKSTEGVHICYRCANQLKTELSKVAFDKD